MLLTELSIIMNKNTGIYSAERVYHVSGWKLQSVPSKLSLAASSCGVFGSQGYQLFFMTIQ